MRSKTWIAFLTLICRDFWVSKVTDTQQSTQHHDSCVSSSLKNEFIKSDGGEGVGDSQEREREASPKPKHYECLVWCEPAQQEREREREP